ncbi:uncharacterized protein LOC105703723 isoform X2 [Orussus abietinus]|uniref:uncharacterized protein LOC105703723 isoform X2 n=1 Tax=Orussus abietinus TaxID=222816 RepID=UPI0006260D3B|nr:uncharacterized protein LOC105703723 isoform X2 [Orussus abietinus]
MARNSHNCSDKMSKKGRKRKFEGEEQVMVDWEKENILPDDVKDEMESMWEIPQIFHFLYLTKDVLNIPHLSMYEMERMLLMPRASKQLGSVMTCLLSSPVIRTKVRRIPPMPYEFWTNILAHKAKSWFKIYLGKHQDSIKVLETTGIEPEFWKVFPDPSSIEDKDFEMLSFKQRVWLLKTVCDTIMHSRKTVQEEVAKQRWEDQAETVLGTDRHGARYIYFPQFIDTDLRVYRHCLDNKVLSTVKPVQCLLTPKPQTKKEESKNSKPERSRRRKFRWKRGSLPSRTKARGKKKQEEEGTASDCKCSADSAIGCLASEDTSFSSVSACSHNTNNNHIDMEGISSKRSRSSSKTSEESTTSALSKLSNAKSSGYDTNGSIDAKSADEARSKQGFKGFEEDAENPDIAMISGILTGLTSKVDSMERGASINPDESGRSRVSPDRAGSKSQSVDPEIPTASVSKTDDEKLNEIICNDSSIDTKEIPDTRQLFTSKSDDEKLIETKGSRSSLDLETPPEEETSSQSKRRKIRNGENVKEEHGESSSSVLDGWSERLRESATIESIEKINKQVQEKSSEDTQDSAPRKVSRARKNYRNRPRKRLKSESRRSPRQHRGLHSDERHLSESSDRPEEDSDSFGKAEEPNQEDIFRKTDGRLESGLVREDSDSEVEHKSYLKAQGRLQGDNDDVQDSGFSEVPVWNRFSLRSSKKVKPEVLKNEVEDFQEMLADLAVSTFELVADSVEALRELAASFSDEDPDQKATDRARPPCEVKLAQKMVEMIESLEKTEAALKESTRKARAKLQKEWNNFKNGIVEDQDRDWSGVGGLSSNWWVIGSQGCPLPSTSDPALQAISQLALPPPGAQAHDQSATGDQRRRDGESHRDEAQRPTESQTSPVEDVLRRADDENQEEKDLDERERDESSSKEPEEPQTRRVLRARGVSSYTEQLYSEETDEDELEGWSNPSAVHKTSCPQDGAPPADAPSQAGTNDDWSEDSDQDWILPGSRKRKNKRSASHRRLRASQGKPQSGRADSSRESSSSRATPADEALDSSRGRVETKESTSRTPEVPRTPGEPSSSRSPRSAVPSTPGELPSEMENASSVHSELDIKEENPGVDQYPYHQEGGPLTGYPGAGPPGEAGVQQQGYLVVKSEGPTMSGYLLMQPGVGIPGIVQPSPMVVHQMQQMQNCYLPGSAPGYGVPGPQGYQMDVQRHQQMQRMQLQQHNMQQQPHNMQQQPQSMQQQPQSMQQQPHNLNLQHQSLQQQQAQSLQRHHQQQMQLQHQPPHQLHLPQRIGPPPAQQMLYQPQKIRHQSPQGPQGATATRPLHPDNPSYLQYALNTPPLHPGYMNAPRHPGSTRGGAHQFPTRGASVPSPRGGNKQQINRLASPRGGFSHPNGAVIRSQMPVRGSFQRMGSRRLRGPGSQQNLQRPTPRREAGQKTTSLIVLSDSDDEIEMIITEKDPGRPQRSKEEARKKPVITSEITVASPKNVLPPQIMQRMNQGGISITPVKPPSLANQNSGTKLVVVVNETGSHYALALPNGSKLILTPEQVAQIRASNGGKLVL